MSDNASPLRKSLGSLRSGSSFTDESVPKRCRTSPEVIDEFMSRFQVMPLLMPSHQEPGSLRVPSSLNHSSKKDDSPLEQEEITVDPTSDSDGHDTADQPMVHTIHQASEDSVSGIDFWKTTCEKVFQQASDVRGFLASGAVKALLRCINRLSDLSSVHVENHSLMSYLVGQPADGGAKDNDVLKLLYDLEQLSRVPPTATQIEVITKSVMELLLRFAVPQTVIQGITLESFQSGEDYTIIKKCDEYMLLSRGKSVVALPVFFLELFKLYERGIRRKINKKLENINLFVKHSGGRIQNISAYLTELSVTNKDPKLVKNTTEPVMNLQKILKSVVDMRVGELVAVSDMVLFYPHHLMLGGM